MSPAEEQELLTRCREGDANAWDRFFAAHYEPAARFLFQLVPDATPEDIEEICQEVFLSAIRNLDGFAGRSRVQTWVFRIAANRARDFRNRRLAAKRGGGRVPLSLDREDPSTGLRPDPPGAGKSPAEELASEEDMAEVRRALDQLGDPCREILELRYFADLDYESIASTLRLNPRTVSSRLSRCLDKLGALLGAGREGEENRRLAV